MFKKNSLIVSCQATGNDPFNSPLEVMRMAKAAEMGGADGIRSEGLEKTKCIINAVKLPVIGLIKSKYNNGYVKITRSSKDIENLLEIGCNLIAIDGTERLSENLLGYEFISYIKKNYNCKIIADISNTIEAIKCADSGADFISTTLNGYTEETIQCNNGEPNINLIRSIVAKRISIPVFAEGRIWSVEQVHSLIQAGANGVIIGTAITSPRLVTNHFKNALIEK